MVHRELSLTYHLVIVTIPRLFAFQDHLLTLSPTNPSLVRWIWPIEESLLPNRRMLPITGSVSTTGIPTTSPKHNESSTDKSMKRQDTFQDSARLHDNVNTGKQVKAAEAAEISGLLCYAPHGLRLSSAQKLRISSLAPKKGICLLSTLTLYDLPLILGGTVNLGMQIAI